jgi:hypothetical protein
MPSSAPARHLRGRQPLALPTPTRAAWTCRSARAGDILLLGQRWSWCRWGARGEVRAWTRTGNRPRRPRAELLAAEAQLAVGFDVAPRRRLPRGHCADARPRRGRASLPAGGAPRPGHTPEQRTGAPHNPGRAARGQGLLRPRHPSPALRPRHPGGHPRARRPGPSPQEPRLLRRPAGQLRPRGLQGPQHHRAGVQPAQELARHRHPLPTSTPSPTAAAWSYAPSSSD